MTEKRILVAFDFDNTLIDVNSDTYVIKLAPGGRLPHVVKSVMQSNGWTAYMNAVFRYLHHSKVTEQDIKKCMQEVPFSAGMDKLLEYITITPHIDAIIISDSNSILIDEVLKFYKVRDVFCEVFTNPAVYDASGCLKLEPYQKQDWCDLSTVNMCKGSILREFIKLRLNDNVKYKTVCYVGDGSYDICPCRTLRSEDLACPRSGYQFWENLQAVNDDAAVKNLGIKAEIMPWHSGTAILERLRKMG